MKVKQLTLAAMFAALCAVGGLFKIPLGVSSTALDSVPALVSALFLPPVIAGMTALVGHLASALFGGFMLGPFHFLIALEMLLVVYVFAKMHRANLRIGKWLFFIVANGLLAPIPFYFLISPVFFIGAVPGILLATVVNAVIAIAIMPLLKNIGRKERGKFQ